MQGQLKPKGIKISSELFLVPALVASWCLSTTTAFFLPIQSPLISSQAKYVNKIHGSSHLGRLRHRIQRHNTRIVAFQYEPPTTGGGRESAPGRQPLHTYWWPVLLEKDTPAGRPHAVKLLGKHLVIWKDGKKVRCSDDMCKHRFAPLSEGRVLPDGCIQCSYHGWTFDKNGAIKSVPQVDEEGLAKVQNNPNGKLQTYPCQIAGGMIWVYPDASDDAWEQSLMQRPPISSVLEASGGINGFCRDLPYGYELLGENLIDLAHLPFSHHGIGTLKRTKAGPLPLKLLSPSADPNTGVAPIFECAVEPVSADPIPSQSTKIRFFAPGHIRYERHMIGSGVPFHVELFAVPTDHGSSRVFLFQPGLGMPPAKLPPSQQSASSPTVADKIQLAVRNNEFFLCFWSMLMMAVGLFPRLRATLMPVWHRHVMVSKAHLFSHLIFDGDGIFLRMQGERMSQGGKDMTFREYFTPTSSDIMVLRFRRWLAAIPDGEQQFAKRFSDNIEYSAQPRDVSLDRYSSHTAKCSSCTTAMEISLRQQKSLKVLAAASFLAACVFMGAVRGILGLVVGAVLAVMSGWSMLSSDAITQDLKKYFFVDYVHADKN